MSKLLEKKLQRIAALKAKVKDEERSLQQEKRRSENRLKILLGVAIKSHIAKSPKSNLKFVIEIAEEHLTERDFEFVKHAFEPLQNEIDEVNDSENETDQKIFDTEEDGNDLFAKNDGGV